MSRVLHRRFVKPSEITILNEPKMIAFRFVRSCGTVQQPVDDGFIWSFDALEISGVLEDRLMSRVKSSIECRKL